MDMNKTVKGVCSVCLAAFLAFPTSSLPSVLAGNSGDCSAVSTGEVTNNVTWNIDSGTLKITGTGEMKDFENSSATPWHDSASTITSVIIEEGVTSIGNNAFSELEGVTTVSIASSVKRIGVNAFNANSETEEDGLRYVGNWLTRVDSSVTGEIEIKSGTVGIADFESANENFSSIVLPDSVKYIGKNFLSGSNIGNVYLNGTADFFSDLESKVSELLSNKSAEIHFMVISNGEIEIENLDETPKYHVGDRPTLQAKVKDSTEKSSPRCTIEEKWVSTDGTKEITAKDENKFEEGVVYNYIIVVKPNDKFSFDNSEDPILINGETLSPEEILTFKENFSALISIDSTSFSESKNFDISCNEIGTQPKFIEKVDTDANYSMTYQLWEKIDSSGMVKKRAVSGEYSSAGSEVGALESFEENGSYKYTVCLKPNEGYYFNSKFAATLGGKAASVAFKEDGSVVVTLENLGTKHSFPLAKTEKVEPTCTTAGNKEYYQCPKCSKTFADENAKETLTDIELPSKGGHKFTKVEAKESTCTKKGNIEYFKCNECGTYFKSENGQPGEEITDKTSVELDLIPHTFDESTFISDGENGHYHKCKYCDAHSETVAHTFGEAWLSDSESHYHKCKDCDFKKDVTKHTFDKEIEDKKYLKDGLTCGDVISYYKSCECGESSKGTESEETFENKEGKKVEHEFGKDGVCTICEATDYKVSAVDGSTYYETENGSLIFRANGSIDKLLSVKVDGTVLTEDQDYTVKSGSTIVELKGDYLKTLSGGEHTLTVVYEDGQCDAKFNVKASDSKNNDENKNNDDETKNDDNTGSKGNIISDIIYKTGDNAGLISLISTMLTSGLASVWFAKKRRKNR